MRGEFASAWPDFVDEVLGRLSLEWSPPIEWAADLCFATANSTEKGSDVHAALMSANEHPDDAIDLLLSLSADSFKSEAAICSVVPALLDVCDEYDSEMAEAFAEMTKDFAARFSLRYNVSDECKFLVSITGLVAGLVDTVSRLGEKSPSVRARLDDVEGSISDVESDPSNDRRIRDAIRYQFILVEELAKSSSSTTKHTLGDMCKELDDWPHQTYGKALSTLYGFRNDFPAMGHSGNPAGASRKLDARDVASMAAILFGFAPYLTDELDGSAGLVPPSEVAL